MFKPGTTVQRGKGPHIVFLKSQGHLTLAVTQSEDVGPLALPYISVIRSYDAEVVWKIMSL